MPEVPDLPRPSQLWKQLTPERKLEAATAFWTDENAAMEQAEAIATIAQRIKFRTKSVVTMPVEKKARQLAALGAVSEMVAARLLVAYHLSAGNLVEPLTDVVSVAENQFSRIGKPLTEQLRRE